MEKATTLFTINQWNGFTKFVWYGTDFITHCQFYIILLFTVTVGANCICASCVMAVAYVSIKKNEKNRWDRWDFLAHDCLTCFHWAVWEINKHTMNHLYICFSPEHLTQNASSSGRALSFWSTAVVLMWRASRCVCFGYWLLSNQG